jgi:carbon monoxide dehydrogenase subunit G
MNPEVLTRITPGISRLEQIEEDQFKAIADVKIGPVKGSFEGNLKVAEKKEPERFVLKITQKSKIGNVSADVAIALNKKEDGQTEMEFDGKAKLSGLLARTGQRVLSGVANTLTKQFFKALEKELA